MGAIHNEVNNRLENAERHAREAAATAARGNFGEKSVSTALEHLAAAISEVGHAVRMIGDALERNVGSNRF